ncbi:tetratricopeptide repeat protein [Actinosynnema sp. NPDC023587]|uniref:tetratricopeptide repeat protein n=1 Tax=Actinosynnema sp. NPDC023587 TaxID=3154695 RepID=UPI0033F9A3AE
MDLGAPHGIRFRFEAGLVRAVLRRRFDLPEPARWRLTAFTTGLREFVRAGAPGGIERAYLHVGTVDGQLDERRDRSATYGAAARGARGIPGGARGLRTVRGRGCRASGPGGRAAVPGAADRADRGRPEEARQAAPEAQAAFRANCGGARLMEAIGVLGELSDDHATPVRYAVEGPDLAGEPEDRPRRAAVTFEECVRRHAAGDLVAAVDAGVRAVELFRAEGDGPAELAALRELGACHRDLGELETARHCAEVAVALAERLGGPLDVAACLDELGRVLTRGGDHAAALEHYRHAVELLVAKGEWERGAALLPHLAVGAVRAGDPGALWTTALCGGLICEIAPRATWAVVVPLVVDSMRRAIETGPQELTERGMTDFAHAVTTGKRDDMPFQVGVLADVVVVLLAWLMDRVDRDIVAFARELDTATGGVLDLSGYIAVPHADRVRDPGQVRAHRT